jgi:uncharacterized protein YfaQ (DUF2300 family)
MCHVSCVNSQNTCVSSLVVLRQKVLLAQSNSSYACVGRGVEGVVCCVGGVSDGRARISDTAEQAIP